MGKRDFPEKIKKALMSISSGRNSYQEILELVKISRVIVISYLNYSKRYTQFLCTKNGISPSDLAYDCIAELFEKRDTGEYKNLNSFYNSLPASIEELYPLDVYLAYKSFLFRIVDANEARLCAQLDPSGYKIIRNIKDVCAVGDNFSLIKRNNELFLTIPQSNNGEQKIVTLEEIENDFISQANKTKNTKELLITLKNVIINRNEYKKEIHLNEAVELFKRYFGVSEQTELDYISLSLESNKSELDELELRDAHSKVLSKLKEKILINYFAKGKLTKEQASAIYSALNDIIDDWIKIGKNSDSIYDYFNTHLKICQREYHLHIKDKIEYLIKEARKEFLILLHSKE